MRRKAQIQQVFVYLMAMLVIGFLVLFGYRMINKLLDQKCDLEDNTLITRITQDIDKSTRFASRTKIELNKPCDYNELCIVDKDMFVPGNQLPSIYEVTHPLIWANTADDIKYNIYLRQPNGDTFPLLYDERIHTDIDGTKDNITCVKVQNGQFTFWLEGLGKQGVLASSG